MVPERAMAKESASQIFVNHLFALLGICKGMTIGNLGGLIFEPRHLRRLRHHPRMRMFIDDKLVLQVIEEERWDWVICMACAVCACAIAHRNGGE